MDYSGCVSTNRVGMYKVCRRVKIGAPGISDSSPKRRFRALKFLVEKRV